MRKTDRIDQILIKLGHVTKGDVDRAIERQKEAGGRIGENLIEIGALTEEQLFDALVEQFRIPTVTVDENVVAQGLLDRMPVEALRESLIVPVGWNEQFGVLSLAVANPSDTEAIKEVGRAFGAKKVRVSLAPEKVLASLIADLVGEGEGKPGPRAGGTQVRLVALPELFEPEDTEGDELPADEAEVGGAKVVIVTTSPVEKNFLPSVFRPDGFEVVVVSDPEAASEAIEGAHAVLVSQEMTDHFDGWRADGVLGKVVCDVVRYGSVARTMLETAAPYPRMAAATRSAVAALAEARARDEKESPPYSLVTADLEALAARVGLGRLETDGLVVGAHLLLPVERGSRIEPFQRFAATMELAHRMAFPWPVDELLSSCLGLYLGRVQAGEPAGRGDVHLAAQLLALVWFRHNVLVLEEGHEGDPMVAVRTALRELAGRLASQDVVETYLDVMSKRAETQADVDLSALVVGGERVQKAMKTALERIGCRVDLASEVTRGYDIAKDVRPAVVILDHEGLGDGVEQACKVFRVDRSALLYVVTQQSDPAVVLNLLDLGVDDVFAPPHDFDVLAARLHRALRTRSAPRTSLEDSTLAARFEALSFLDLAQMLSNGLKTVRIELRSDEGEEAVLFLDKGRPVFAECGALQGPQAVYRVIAWDDEGEFSVHDAAELPEPNIAESVESLLMEGVRLLDESRA